MRYVYNNENVICKVEDDNAIISTASTNSIITFNSDEEAISFFENNNINYSILLSVEENNNFE